jgi:hypothetical protein
MENGGMINMSVYQWLCVLGIPGMIAGLLTFIKVQLATNKAIKLGVQAVLRDRLLQAYEFYMARGYANYDEKSNVRNMYDQYEALGPNGIMEQKHEDFIRLPDRPNNGGN